MERATRKGLEGGKGLESKHSNSYHLICISLLFPKSKQVFLLKYKFSSVTTLPEDPGSASSIHMVAHNHF